VGKITAAIGPAAAAVFAMLAGFASGATSGRTGATGTAITGAGSVGAAIVGSMAVRKPSLRTGLWVGALAAPILKGAMDALRGTELPMGIKLTLEDSQPFRLSDYLANRGADGFSDYFRYEPNAYIDREPAGMSGYGGSGRFSPFQSV
jgi:hypothetical protein